MMHLWQYYRDKPVVNDANGNIFDFSVYSASFKSKLKITREISADGTKKGVETAVPLRNPSNYYN